MEDSLFKVCPGYLLTGRLVGSTRFVQLSVATAARRVLSRLGGDVVRGHRHPSDARGGDVEERLSVPGIRDRKGL